MARKRIQTIMRGGITVNLEKEREQLSEIFERQERVRKGKPRLTDYKFKK